MDKLTIKEYEIIIEALSYYQTQATHGEKGREGCGLNPQSKEYKTIESATNKIINMQIKKTV